MTVEELIDTLKLYNPKATVLIEEQDSDSFHYNELRYIDGAAIGRHAADWTIERYVGSANEHNVVIL